MKQPLILLTNDDGITSPGLWAAAEAVRSLGEVLIVAPDRQWSGAGRAMPHDATGCIQALPQEINGVAIAAYAVDGSPAQVVQHGMLELAPRKPSLVISGINSGANITTDVTISGTVGAALEASAFGIPSLAVSLEMDPQYYLTGNDEADYTAAQAYIHQLAQQLLAVGLPYGIDVLNLNIPSSATPDTPWRLTRLSRYRYFDPLPPDRSTNQGRPGYRINQEPAKTELDSDLFAMLVDRIVSITPLSLDMTAQLRAYDLESMLPIAQNVAAAVM
jgi:5'-nucleotidase